MSVLNRNIITPSDITNLGTARSKDQVPPALRETPPANATIPRAGDEKSEPTKDDYLAKLVKYIPPEVLAAYLLLSSVVAANTAEGTTENSIWLGCLLATTVVATLVYNSSVLGVVRLSQNLMSALGLIVYVFGVGGWFATMNWYETWHPTFAFVGYGLLVAVVKLPPLPNVPGMSTEGTASAQGAADPKASAAGQ